MTEETQEAIEDAPEETLAADNDAPEVEQEEESQETEDNTEGETEGEVEFPKKAVNALNRKNKQINKLRAQMRELEAKLNEEPEKPEPKHIDESQYDTWEEYNAAKVEALVDEKTKQTQSDMERQQLAQQKEMLQAQRNQHIREQAEEATEVFSDLPQVWSENAQLLDSLPEEISDIFYSIDHAPAAVYTLAKEG